MRSPSVSLVKQLRRRRDGSTYDAWVLRWPRRDGRIATETIGRVGELTERDAGKLRRKKIADLEVGNVLRDPSRLTVSQFLEDDRAMLLATRAKSTATSHETVANRLLAAIDGAKRLDRVDSADVARLQTWMTTHQRVGDRDREPLSRATVAVTLATLRAAWNRAVRRGLVVTNPFAGERMPKVQSARKRVLTPEEASVLLDVVADCSWWTCLIRLALETGLRLGELNALTWDDLELPTEVGSARARVTVAAKRSGAFRVAGERFPILEWQAKDHETRSIPVSDDLALVLQRHRMVMGGSRYVFLTLARLRALEAARAAGRLPEPSKWVNNARRDFLVRQGLAQESLAARHGVEPDAVEWEPVTFHDLRRTFGTRLAQSGLPANDLKAYMGHASITTTMDFYVGLTDDSDSRVLAAVAAS